MTRFTEKIFMSYANTVILHPVLVIFTTITISSLVTTWSIYFNFSKVVDFDPTKGFETRGTLLSQARLTLEAMKPQQASNQNILKWYFEQDLTRKKRSSKIENITTTLDPITVNYDDYGVNSEPNIDDLNDHCEMFASIGKSLPFDMIEFLGKIMIRVSSYDQLFTVPVMKHICEIDNILDNLIQEYNSTKEVLKHSLNIPLYTTCHNLKTENSCEAINEEDVLNFRHLLKTCRNNSSLEICSVFSINQVNNWLLPRVENEELVITVILKVAMWNGVDNREVYDQIIDRVETHLRKNPHLRMAGVSLNMKNRIFQERLQTDSLIAGISASLVFICFLIYSKSLLFTGIIFIIITLSSGVAFFVYTNILGIDFFPFVNLLVLVILISIGADDAFLLLVYFRREVEKLSTLDYKIGSIYIPLYRESDLIFRSLRLSLHHSLASMFVTSLTTATCFLTNLSSPIIVLRCFGIYAAITVIVNYLLVILILPGVIILVKPIRKRSSSDSSMKPESISISSKIADFTFYFRYGVVFLSFIFTGLSILVIFFNPGLTIPTTNPTKLLVDSNPHEYYDNHVHRFNFEWQRSARLVKNFIFGVESVTEPSGLGGLSPYHRPGLNFSTTASNYQLTLEKLELYRKIVERESKNYHLSVNYTHNSWADRILQTNISCLSENSTILPSCVLKSSIKNKNLIHQFPDDFAVIPGDGPFVDNDLRVVGYFISIPTDRKLRIDSVEIEKLFDEIDSSCQHWKNLTQNPVICMSSYEITRFYDIVSQLRSSSLMSIAISLGVCLLVIILCTRTVKLSIFASIVISFVILWTIAILISLGWQLSVVESTILIITIGLSFDYTLHYVVAIKDCTDKCIESAHGSAGIACLFGAITLILAGFPLLFTKTASFYQIGTMLVVLGTTSLLGASIVLPAFVMTFQRRLESLETSTTKM